MSVKLVDLSNNEDNAPTIAVVDDVNPHEGISDVGRKCSSQGSSKSGGSSTASARLRAQADKAALKARSSALKERCALERSRSNSCGGKEKQLGLEVDMAAAIARLEVLQSSDAGNSSSGAKKK